MSELHLVAHSIYPASGGAQESVARIANGLAAQGCEVVVYTLAAPSVDHPPDTSSTVPVVDLSGRISGLIEPYRATEREALMESEWSRAALLALREAVAERIGTRRGRSVFLSFYASTVGFVVQHVALRLGIPHIASSRGTDFARDLLSGKNHAKVRFVAERANQLITTNHEQAEALAATFDVRAPIRTIHNAILDVDRPLWTSPPLDEVRLVSDTGFSGRKATHFLIAAVESLIKKGLPVKLTLLGGIFPSDSPQYWTQLREEISSRYPKSYDFPGPVPREEVDAHLRSAHIYCSATLAEGCSLSRIRALTLGIPIVTTRCGALPEVALNSPHVRLCAPGDVESLERELECAVRDCLDGRLHPDPRRVEEWRRHFSPKREQQEWRQTIETVAPDFAAAG